MNFDPSKQIISNKIRTPDGTILESFHRHDYKTYVDKNGLEYMVDGGLDYLRRNVHDQAPYEELSVSADCPFETFREEMKWGTRGKDGKQPLKYVPLKKLTVEHIQAILDTQTQILPWLRNAFQQELRYRLDSK